MRVYRGLTGERGRKWVGSTRHGRRYGQLLAEFRDELRPPMKGATCRDCRAYGVPLDDGRRCRVCADVPST